MNDQMGDQQPQSSQDRYYERYLQDTDPTLRSSGPRRGGGRNGMIAGGVAAAVLLGGGGVFLATRGGGEVNQGGAPTSTTASAPTTGSQTTTSSSTTSTTSTTSSTTVDAQAERATKYGPALKSGWTIVAGKEATIRAAYDVPSTDKWTKPTNSGDLRGWTTENKEDKSVIASAPSEYAEGHCESYKAGNAGFVGFINIGTRDPSEAAPDVVLRTSKLVRYNKTTKQYAKASAVRTRQINVNGGKTPAIESLITFENGDVDTKKCDGKNYEARTVAFTGNGVSTMLLIIRNMDYTDKMPDQDILDIIASLRPMK